MDTNIVVYRTYVHGAAGFCTNAVNFDVDVYSESSTDISTTSVTPVEENLTKVSNFLLGFKL